MKSTIFLFIFMFSTAAMSFDDLCDTDFDDDCNNYVYVEAPSPKKLHTVILEYHSLVHKHTSMSLVEIINSSRKLISNKEKQIPNEDLSSFREEAGLYLSKLESFKRKSDLIHFEKNILSSLTVSFDKYFKNFNEVQKRRFDRSAAPGAVLIVQLGDSITYGLYDLFVTSLPTLIENAEKQENFDAAVNELSFMFNYWLNI